MAKKQPQLEELAEAFFEAVHDQDAAARELAEQRDALRHAICRLFGRGNYENGRRFLIELLGGLPGS